ncbi:MAG: ImmA/IrrE family metallo-endopeptidase, partial [candidate division NC10 bacterium]|nr:ImmA/IrrE family metallo-endopeptidase [candidate division NC10 bacterium]
LGHHFFHPGLDLLLLKRTLFSRDKIEQEANAFALCALLPTPVLEQLIREKG